MERELVIKLNMDRARADAAGQAFAAEEKQRHAKLLSDVEVIEAAKTQAVIRENQRRIASHVALVEAEKGGQGKLLSDVEAKEAAWTQVIARENQKRIASHIKTFAEEEAQVAKLLSHTEIAERAKAAVVERTNKQRVDAAVRAEMGEEQTLTKLITKEQAVFQARNSLIAKHNQQRVAAELKAMDASQSGWAGTDAAIGGAARSLTSFAGQMLGISSAQAIISTIVENFRAAKREAMEAAKFVQGYREALLELAALRGRMGQTTEELRENLAFRAKTLQTAEAATAFQTAALGAGESAIGVNISKEEFGKAMELGGKFQATEKGAAETHGTLIGMIPTLMGKKGVTGAEAFAKEQQLFSIFQPGGGSFSQMTNQFLQQAPLVTAGIYKDPATMAALLSAFSTTNKEGAGTNVQQFTRATVGGLGRMRGANVEGSVEKQAEFLKRIGATDQMDPTQIGKLISGEFTREEQLAGAKGETFNPMTYMQKHGYMNQEDIMAVMAFHGMMKSGQFEGTFEKRAATMPSADEAMKRIEQAQLDPVFRGRKRELAEDLSKVPKGVREEELEDILGPAFSTLKQKGKITGEYADVMSSSWWNSSKELIFGQQQMVGMEAQHQLAEEAKRLGIDPGITFRRSAKTGAITGEDFLGEEGLINLSRKIRARGGEDQPGVKLTAEAADQKLEEQTQLLRGIHDEMKKSNEQREGKAPPVIQGRPAVQTR